MESPLPGEELRIAVLQVKNHMQGVSMIEFFQGYFNSVMLKA